MIYLIPTHLGNPDPALLPAYIKSQLAQCDILFVEHLKTARHFIKSMRVEKAIDDFQWELLDKDTDEATLLKYIQLTKDKTCGILSEAGVPAVADPGAALVKLAHRHNIPVKPMIGPSSLILALMGSGMNGQQFAFHGYLPVEKAARVQRIKLLEQKARKDKETQLFIETPYRNNALLTDLVEQLAGDTLLCIGTDLTLETELLQTKKVKEWKLALPDLNKRPAVFLIA
jgi:16S rRNA (cytidine1402-2'-O)-methyltransferase